MTDRDNRCRPVSSWLQVFQRLTANPLKSNRLQTGLDPAIISVGIFWKCSDFNGLLLTSLRQMARQLRFGCFQQRNKQLRSTLPS